MKKTLILSLLVGFVANAQALTDSKVRIDQVIADLAAGKTIEQIISAAEKKTLQAVIDLSKVTPESITEIIFEAITANPDQAAEIVQTAVVANPELANEIVTAAVLAGANQDEMIAVALLAGANEKDLELATASGGIGGTPTLRAAPAQLGAGTAGIGITASPN